MTQVCSGLCIRFKSAPLKNSLRYKVGQKRCSLCALFFITQKNTCSCCKTRLRSRPRSKKDDLPRI